MLHLVGIQHGDGVAIGNTDNQAGDDFGIGSAGQRQQHGRDYLLQCIHM